MAHIFADLGDLLPLGRRRVDTGRVMGTGVEEDGGTGGSSLQVSDHTLVVKGDGVLVVVAVVLGLEAGILEDSLVVGPGRGRDANLLLAGAPALEESSSEAESAGAGDGLGDGELVEDGRVVSVGKLGGSLREAGHTGDASVLLVGLALDNALLGLADGGEDVGLARVIAVGTNAKIDLLAVGVGFESLGDTQDSLNRSIVREKGDVCHVQSRDAETGKLWQEGYWERTSGGPWGTLNQMDRLRAATTGATR
jgi:hypothetical protein